MKTTRRALLLGAAGAALAGCATGGLVSGSVQNAGATVPLTREWSDITFLMPPPRPRNVKLLSVDGPLLNRLYIATLAPGESLLRPRDRDTPRPTFQSDMSDSEIVEFIIDCVAQEYQSPEASALRPQNFGAAPGVRFDIATSTAEGLNISGSALAARRGDSLHLMLFLAPAEHYYGALMPDVERMFSGATLS